MYNKRQFNKVNEKKVMHKVRKHWVIIPLSLLSLLGGGVLITSHANASNINDNQNNYKDTLNQQLQKQNSNSSTLINNTKPANSLTNGNTSEFSNSNNSISARASMLHSRIMAHAMAPNIRVGRTLGNYHNNNRRENGSNNIEQAFKDGSNEYGDIENGMNASDHYLMDLVHYINKYSFDTTGGINKGQIKLSPENQLPQDNDVIPSNVHVNDNSNNSAKSLKVPIHGFLTGNNNNLISDYANRDGTGGINAKLLSDGTFFMHGGVENTGYFSPATMKIGWPDLNGTQSDNNNYINSLSDSDDGAPYSKYNADVNKEDFSDVRVTGDMGDQFAEQPNMKVFTINNCNFDGTSDYNGFFSDDNNLQSIQFSNTKGIQGSPSDWDLVDAGSWKDEKTGSMDDSQMTNGDVWINTKNKPISHTFSIPVLLTLVRSDGSTILQNNGSRPTEYAIVKGLLNHTTFINLSQLSLPGYKNVNPNSDVAISFKASDGRFYYTAGNNDSYWTDNNGGPGIGKDPILQATFATRSASLAIDSLTSRFDKDLAKLDSYREDIDTDKANSKVAANLSASSSLDTYSNEASNDDANAHVNEGVINYYDVSEANTDVYSASLLASDANNIIKSLTGSFSSSSNNGPDNASQPSASQPSASQPSASQPSASQPSASQPSASQPSASQPSASQPSASQPSASQPSATSYPSLDSASYWNEINSNYSQVESYYSAITSDESNASSNIDNANSLQSNTFNNDDNIEVNNLRSDAMNMQNIADTISNSDLNDPNSSTASNASYEASSASILYSSIEAESSSNSYIDMTYSEFPNEITSDANNYNYIESPSFVSDNLIPMVTENNSVNTNTIPLSSGEEYYSWKKIGNGLGDVTKVFHRDMDESFQYLGEAIHLTGYPNNVVYSREYVAHVLANHFKAPLNFPSFVASNVSKPISFLKNLWSSMKDIWSNYKDPKTRESELYKYLYNTYYHDYYVDNNKLGFWL